MLRVCGITYDHTINYGSCFQAYALQTAVERTVVGEGETCEYRLIPVKTFRDWPKGKWFVRWFELLMLFFHTYFLPFEREYMRFADVSCMEELSRLNAHTDAYICGSDVIWNPDFNYGFTAFFLDFTNRYKFSYAASFGKAELPEDYMHRIAKHLRALDQISVREETGIAVVAKYTGRSAEVVIDPVFLLDRADWDQVAGPKANKGKYIFVYATHLNPTIKSFVSQLHKKSGLRVEYSASGPKQAMRLGLLRPQTPQRWLQQLRDAEYVVTNSFHATAFSTIFHKKFFTVVHGEKDKGINIRMNDYLRSIGLDSRLFSAVPEEIDTGEIDYSEADRRIESLKQSSLDFLHSNLEAAYQQKLNSESKEQS